MALRQTHNTWKTTNSQTGVKHSGSRTHSVMISFVPNITIRGIQRRMEMAIHSFPSTPTQRMAILKPVRIGAPAQIPVVPPVRTTLPHPMETFLSTRYSPIRTNPTMTSLNSITAGHPPWTSRAGISRIPTMTWSSTKSHPPLRSGPGTTTRL